VIEGYEVMNKAISQRAVVVLVLLVGSVAFAQMGMSQGMGMHMPNYDPTRVVTVKGTIEEVQSGMMRSGQMGQMRGMDHMGLHLTLKTGKAPITVLVGPSSFVKEKNFAFAKGDTIEVTGSQVKYDNADALIAREIKKDDKTLTLRNEQGVPEWSQGRRIN
jgi:hypothetical protein